MIIAFPNRRRFIRGLSALAFISLAGCSSSGSDVQDSDDDGVIDDEDYAPEDPQVQEKSDIQSGKQTEQSDSPPTEQGVQDSDGDGVIDSEDYAPEDSQVQEKSDIQSGKQTEQSDSTTTEQSVQARIGAIDVDVQVDIGQNNIGFDVETYFDDSAVLTVIVSDGEASDQRSFEAISTDGFQEFNDDIDPPDAFQDNEEFTITFKLSVDGEIVDEKQLTHTYSE